MKHKYHIVANFSGYDVFAVDPQNGGSYQIGYGLPHWDAAVRVAVIHASGPVVFEGTAL